MQLKNKSVTMADIAHQLGISKNAVSLALRGKDGVSEELRDRVIATAKELGYTTSEKLEGCILALVPMRLDIVERSMFYHLLCYEMERYAASLGHPLVLSSVSETDEARCLPPISLSSMPCVGVITVGNLSKDYCRMIQRMNLRYVMADQYYDDLAVDSVTTANTSGMYLMTEHLIQKGHTNIQYFGTRFRTASLEDRWVGYKRALTRYDLPIRHNSFIDIKGEKFDEYTMVEQAIRELDERGELPTAFVCGHDQTAASVIQAMEKLGRTCPKDFSIVGFDDIPDAHIQDLSLTSYSTPKVDIAHAVIDLLLSPASTAPRRVQLFGKVVYRGSVREL